MPAKFNRIICTAILLAVSVSAKSSSMNYFSKGDFYGHTTTFTYNSEMQYALNSNIKDMNARITDFEERINKSKPDEIIVSIDKYAADFELDDMGYLLLTKKFIQQTFPHKSDEFKQLLFWSILNKKGYDVLLGYEKNAVTTYGLTNLVAFGTPFVVKNNERYYDLDFKENKTRSLTKIYTSHEKRDEKRERIEISYFKPPKLTAHVGNKSYNFNYGNGSYRIQGSINQSLTEYFKDLPIIGIGQIYVNYGFSDQVRETVIHQLKEIVKNKPTFEQLNILLRFVQEAIPYKTDQEFLGKEHYSFPEETLFNSYSDCEDKAMLYAALVKEILGIKAVAIYYKELEHINVALQMSTVTDNYTFKYKGTPYIICEPAAHGFKVGETTEAYIKGLSAKNIIPLY